MNKWQIEGNEAPRQWQGYFLNKEGKRQFSIHPGANLGKQAKAPRS